MTHNLIEVYSHGNDMEETVIRWCTKCGAIVVDTDYDGRTKPGDIVKMKFAQNGWCLSLKEG